MSLAKRQQLLELSYKHNVLIIEDSPYRELRYRHDHIPALYALDSNGGNVIGVYTFSKMFVPGIRVGFNIGPAEVIEKFSYIKGANILCTPKLNQDICTYFLTQYDLGSHICRLKNFYLQKLDHFLKCLNDHFPPELNVTWTKPDGGLFLWIELPRHVDTKALFFEALQNKVAFVPGHVFYPESAEQYHAMRVNFSYPTLTQAEEGIKRLARAIKKKL
jgi:2-aminoadipate transaminase